MKLRVAAGEENIGTDSKETASLFAKNCTYFAKCTKNVHILLCIKKHLLFLSHFTEMIIFLLNVFQPMKTLFI